MKTIEAELIADIRSASRDLVRQFGFLRQTVAGTDLSPSAVHAIIEIGLSGELSARQLSERLQLEKSTISRLVKSLAQRELVDESQSRDDRRVKRLRLTPRGRRLLESIDDFAETQVKHALRRLDRDSRQCVRRGLAAYAGALAAIDPDNGKNSPGPDFEIADGYAPTIVARTVGLMHLYMHENFGFGARFESRIATDMAEFMTRIDSPANNTWRALRGNDVIGSISIDGEDLGNGLAHLRWFVVAGAARGSGVGRALLARATAFCDALGYRETHLWTVSGLDAARRLYEQQGFVLAEEYHGDQWGSRVLEQRFVRPARGTG